jgi:hypothetical protein
VGVFATLDRGTETVRRVKDLVGETLGHRLLAAGLGVAGEPAQREGVRAQWLDLDGHLVRRTTDAARTHLERGAHVVERLLQGGNRILAALLGNVLEGTVDDALGLRLLAVEQDLVDELRDDGRLVDGVDDDGALRRGTLPRHYFSFFAP